MRPPALAGVGVTWYTWLEQGRDINVSAQVLEAISRTLRLDRLERNHLYTLAGIALGPATGECDALPDSVHRMEINNGISTRSYYFAGKNLSEGERIMLRDLQRTENEVGYSRDLDAVLERVASGTAQAAFVLRPPAVSDVVAVAGAGQVMPQKSTYFYPKPASGIVFNPLDPAIRIPAV